MKVNYAWVGLLFGGLAGCYAPMGPLGHRPDLLFDMRPALAERAQKQEVTGPVLLVPMLSSQVTYPTGGFYNLQVSDLGPLAHTYGSHEPEVALYEHFVDALRLRGHNAVRDYDVGRMPLPGENLFFLRGELRGLEIDSIHPDPEKSRGEDERTVYDAARARLVFTGFDAKGRPAVQFAVVAASKIQRGESDILHELGTQIAIEVDGCIQKGQCLTPPSGNASQDSDEPHNDAWAALENARYGEGARP